MLGSRMVLMTSCCSVSVKLVKNGSRTRRFARLDHKEKMRRMCAVRGHRGKPSTCLVGPVGKFVEVCPPDPVSPFLDLGESLELDPQESSHRIRDQEARPDIDPGVLVD